ncbi:sensory neuron membrane protein 2-like [Tenebrio molitor]|uniref:sensory neuron membrane protein 2-like n=1 Tax=Tenebrio molitor TaxID=7067 RepID=UPI0036247370
MIFPSINSKIILFFLIISSALIILSIILIIQIFPSVIRNEIYKNVQLVEGSEQYERFLELPFPVTFKVYFFNVENSVDVVNGEKPVLKEVGPYIYKQYRKKTVLYTDEKEDTVSYTQTENFEFDNEASGNFSDEDYVTMLNAPMMSILQIAEKYGQTSVLSSCLSDIFPEFDSVFVKVKVKDILFDGIRFCVRHFSLCELRRTIACKIAERKKNVDILTDGALQFSFFNYKVNSNDGLYTIKRGINDVKTLGQIVRLNNSTRTHYWKQSNANSSCDEVKGTDSTLYPPQISKDSIFQIYSTDICRYIEIQFLKEEFYKGVKGYTFATNNLTLRASTTLKEEDCFCTEQTKGVNGEDTCFLDGVIDMQPCTGVPVLLSFPHFLWADEFYSEGVIGLNSNEENHRTFLKVEPETGTPLQGMKRIQINSVLRPINKIKQTEKLPRVVLPLLWIEEGVSLTNKYVKKLEDMYFNKVTLLNILKWTLLAGSIIITSCLGAYLIYKRVNKM